MRRLGAAFLLVSMAGIVAGCRTASRADERPTLRFTPAPTPSPALTTEPTSTLPPAPAPPRKLTICQAEEPNTLFLYGRPSRGALNVLEAIYDGPIDTRNYRFQPVILAKLPSVHDGDVFVTVVEASEGDVVVDAAGEDIILRPKTIVLNADGQEVEFGGGVVTMTQSIVTFTLRSGIAWSDGAPLTADDSRFSFELAEEMRELPLRLLVDQTLSYEVADELTVVWTSIPGYRDNLSLHGYHVQDHYYRNFFQPLPRHVWGLSDAKELLESELAGRYPLGWGPFAVHEWVDGDHITLLRNPHYFRADEGLPYLDQVDIRFVSNLREALSLVEDGVCDVIAQDVIEREAVSTGTLAPLLEAADLGEVRLVEAPSTEWEHVDFSVQRAEWDERAPFFSDVRTRRAVAMCVHRERIAGEAVPYGKADPADSYVSADHPLHGGAPLARYEYDPSHAMALLDAVGWRDEDGDGVREAHGVAEIRDGTPFSVTLLTSTDHLARGRAARILAENMAACGIWMGVEYLPEEELFADGPDGPVFGGQFDLALFSWLNDLDAPCWLYLSSEVPNAQNWWATSNNPGYASEAFDDACLSALASLPGTDAFVSHHMEAQRIFSRDLPVLPLYFVPKLVAVRPGVTGVTLDPTQHLELWAIEQFDMERPSDD